MLSDTSSDNSSEDLDNSRDTTSEEDEYMPNDYYGSSDDDDDDTGQHGGKMRSYHLSSHHGSSSLSPGGDSLLTNSPSLTILETINEDAEEDSGTESSGHWLFSADNTDTDSVIHIPHLNTYRFSHINNTRDILKGKIQIKSLSRLIIRLTLSLLNASILKKN